MARQTLKPPFAYYGGKTTLAPQIAKLLPEHDHYVEPFAGSLAVLLAKEPTTWETVNDLDGELVNFWKVLRDDPVGLSRACHMTPHSRQEYEQASIESSDESDLERARRTWVRITQGRKNSTRRATGSSWRYRIRADVGISWPHQLSSYASRINEVAARISNVSIENKNAIEIIETYGDEKDVCIYADPPYLAATRVSLQQYDIDSADAEFHKELADALRSCKASVVLSGYASEDYESLFEGWHLYEMKAPLTMEGSSRTEALWSNVPLGDQKSLF